MSDILATILIAVGAALCVAFASHLSPVYRLADLEAYFHTWRFLAYVLLTLAFIVVLLLVIRGVEQVQREELERERAIFSSRRASVDTGGMLVVEEGGKDGADRGVAGEEAEVRQRLLAKDGGAASDEEDDSV